MAYRKIAVLRAKKQLKDRETVFEQSEKEHLLVPSVIKIIYNSPLIMALPQ